MEKLRRRTNSEKKKSWEDLHLIGTLPQAKEWAAATVSLLSDQ